MAGIYIHIPFCKKACHYCNFHFSTLLKYKDDFISALLLEIKLKNKDWNKYNYKSVYFGGGTPSILDTKDLLSIIEALKSNYNIDPNIECTIEANPDDINLDKLKEWKSIGINRISLGIQSFNDLILTQMNRTHTAAQAKSALSQIMDIGFISVSTDIIYGMPGISEASLKRDIDFMISSGVQHFSAYALTIEKNTAFHHFIKTGKMNAPNDQTQVEHFYLIRDRMQSNGYNHYEISNYALNSYEAQHNSAYWSRDPYLGLGAGAHSFKDNTRYWNIANNAQYIKSIKQNIIPEESEILSLADQWNELILTGLRTRKGVNKEKLKLFDFYNSTNFNASIKDLISKNKIIETENHFILSENALMFADGVASELFVA